MNSSLIDAMVAVVTAIVGLAALAVFLSGGGRNAATVIKAASGGLSDNIRAAVSPVTGGGTYFGSYGGQGY
jgi:hypothetical protein